MLWTLLAVALTPLLLAGQGRFLDLRREAQAKPSPSSDSSPVLRITDEVPVVPGNLPTADTRRLKAPLRLRILSLDRLNYRYGEPFVVDLVVENIGKTDVALPWSPSPANVSTAPDAPLQSISLALYAEAAPGLTLRMELPHLYGAAFDQNSLNILRPGDSAEIVASGTFEGQSAQEQALGRLNAREVEVRIRATVQWLYAENGSTYGPLESERGPTVMLQTRRQGGP
jgi:hypothetical protein